MSYTREDKRVYVPNKEKPTHHMQLITMYMPNLWVAEIAEQCRIGEFHNRSEFIRYALKKFLLELRTSQQVQKEVF